MDPLAFVGVCTGARKGRFGREEIWRDGNMDGWWWWWREGDRERPSIGERNILIYILQIPNRDKAQMGT